MSSIVIEWSKVFFGDRKWLEKRNIYETIAPFYYLAKMYGYAPFQLGRNQLENQTFFDFFFLILSLICYVFVLYVQIAIENVYQNNLLFVDIGENSLYFLTSCVSVVTLIRMFFNRHKIRDIFHHLNDIDDEVI